MPLEYWIVLGISFTSALISTPIFRRIALYLNIHDQPSDRKIHREPVPYLGGLAFHISMSVSLIFLSLNSPHVLEVQKTLNHFSVLYLIATCFLILGVVDDIRPISAGWKLIFQIIFSIILVKSDFFIGQITSPFGGTLPLGWLGWILSVLWILTIVNAINFIDGMDGLAAGVVFFAAMANLIIALHPWQNFVCLISLILMGATLGFLPYNFSPAKIFMGDAGSLYLGVVLAGSALASNVKGATALSLSLPLVVLSIPLLDTFLTVVRRGKKGRNFFKADREHIHHRLMRLGFSDRQVVLSVYGLSFLLAMSAILAAQLPNRYTMIFILVFLVGIVWGLRIFTAIEKRLINSKEAVKSGETAGKPQQ